MSSDKILPPHSEDAEQAVLGSIIIDPDAFLEISGVINDTHFYLSKNGMIFKAMSDLMNKKQPVDILTLSEVLKSRGQLDSVGGEPYLIGLMMYVPTSINVASYAQIIHAHAKRRYYIRSASKLATAAYDLSSPPDNIDAVAQGMIVNSPTADKDDFVDSPTAISSYMKHIDRIRSRGDGLAGISTGWPKLDAVLGGLRDSSLYIVGGQPGMGKSQVACCIVNYVCGTLKIPAAVFNVELSNDQFISRQVAIHSGIPSSRVEEGRLSDDEMVMFHESCGEVSTWPIHMSDSQITPSSFKRKIFKMHMQYGIKLFVLDHIHRMSHDGNIQRRDLQLKQIVQTMKDTCKELRIPGLLLAQLNQDMKNRQDKRPTIFDFRDSGAILEEADAGIFVYRDGYHYPDSDQKDIMELITAKNRHGRENVTTKLHWNPSSGRISNLVVKPISF